MPTFVALNPLVPSDSRLNLFSLKHVTFAKPVTSLFGLTVTMFWSCVAIPGQYGVDALELGKVIFARDVLELGFHSR